MIIGIEIGVAIENYCKQMRYCHSCLQRAAGGGNEVGWICMYVVYVQPANRDNENIWITTIR